MKYFVLVNLVHPLIPMSMHFGENEPRSTPPGHEWVNVADLLLTVNAITAFVKTVDEAAGQFDKDTKAVR